MERIINLQAISVPNPSALKFEVEGLLLSRDSFEFLRENADDSPLAAALFRLDYVERVFVAGNFITVTKSHPDEPAWEAVAPDVRVLIKRHLEMNLPVITAQCKPLSAAQPENEEGNKLRELLFSKVMPATFSDGGEIVFESFQDGVMKVSLHGACAGCPFAAQTIKQGIEIMACHEFPFVKEVTAEGVAFDDSFTEVH